MTLENKYNPIGVFDSGLGGLTAVKEIMKLLPNEDIIYLGDTARVPYGVKSPETIIKYANQDMNFLEKRGVKIIIAACGTVSSVMISENVKVDERFTGVIIPAAEEACRVSKNGKIGVIATAASIKSGSYEKLIKCIRPDAAVFAKACPMFVPLVENGYTSRDCKATAMFVEEYLSSLRDQKIDTLLLGCTHYPLISEAISDFLGPDVKLISSGAEAAKSAKKKLVRFGLLNDKNTPGKINMFCTDSAELFRENAKHFIELESIDLEQISLGEQPGTEEN